MYKLQIFKLCVGGKSFFNSIQIFDFQFNLIQLTKTHFVKFNSHFVKFNVILSNLTSNLMFIFYTKQVWFLWCGIRSVDWALREICVMDYLGLSQKSNHYYFFILSLAYSISLILYNLYNRTKKVVIVWMISSLLFLVNFYCILEQNSLKSDKKALNAMF